MREESARPDARIAAIAGRQHGVVSYGQLRAAGLRKDAIHRRVTARRLHQLHRGVFAVGHRALSPQGRWMAAALALGDGAAVSHRSAAELWGLLPPARGPVHVSVSGRGGRRRRPGVRVHRPQSLSPGMLTRRSGIPVTTPARTIADLRRSVDPSVLRQAIRQAEVLGLTLPAHEGADGTRSELERRFLRLCHRHRLPQPEVNASVAGLTVDFLWKQQRLVVETDGYRFHRGRAAFEEDRARDLRLRSHGYEVIRLSHRQVVDESGQILGLLRRALSTR